MSVYKETLNFIIHPTMEVIEFTCPLCKERVTIELDGSIYTNTGCDNCGASLDIEAKLCITANPQ